MANGRIRMNTEILQESFPEIYKEFFSRCSVVASTPGVFFWVGEYAVNFGGPAIMQKLPVRVYMGIEPLGEKGRVEYGKLKTFVPSKKRFDDFHFDEYSLKVRLKYIKETVTRLTGKKDFDGFKIHAIYEIPRASGLNLSSVASLALMSAVFLYFDICTLEDYQKGLKKNINELIENYGPFDKLFREAWKLDSMIHGGIASGASIFEALVKSSYPNIYFTEKRCSFFIGDRMENCDAPYPCNVSKDLEQLDKIKFWGFNIGEFFNLEQMPVWPVNFGFIYSGSIKSVGRMSRMIPSLEESLNNLSIFVNTDFKKMMKEERVPYFYQVIKDEKGCGLWGCYLTVLCMVALDFLKSFKDFFLVASPEVLKSFFTSINFYNDMVALLDPGSPATDYIRSFLKEDTAKITEDIGIATKVAGAGRGGDVLFVAPYGSIGSSIYKTVSKMRKKLGKNIWLDYASWEDGYGEQGLLVEQMIEKDIYSKFISRGSISVIHLTEKGTSHTDLYTIDEFEEYKKKNDLIFDPINNKIIIRGKELTSKEIPSSRTTIEIFKILFDNLGKNVFSKDLPPSSYSSSRNEFQSKIVIPLQKELKKALGKELNITIQGTLSNFYVKLKSGNANIYFLEQIF